MYKIYKQKNKTHTIQVIKLRLFTILFMSVVAMVATYVFLLAMTVKNVVERKDLNIRAAALRVEISKMESDYIKAITEISIEQAATFGLSRVTSKEFAERRVLVGQAN